VSVIGHIIFVAYIGANYQRDIQTYLMVCLPPAIIGMILSLLFLYLDSCSSCICTLTPLQIGVLVLDDALVEYVKVKDSGGKKEIITMAEWRERKQIDSTSPPEEDCSGSTSQSAPSEPVPWHTGSNEDESVL
jgi:hypothetical protein